MTFLHADFDRTFGSRLDGIVHGVVFYRIPGRTNTSGIARMQQISSVAELLSTAGGNSTKEVREIRLEHKIGHFIKFIDQYFPQKEHGDLHAKIRKIIRKPLKFLEAKAKEQEIGKADEEETKKIDAAILKMMKLLGTPTSNDKDINLLNCALVAHNSIDILAQQPEQFEQVLAFLVQVNAVKNIPKYIASTVAFSMEAMQRCKAEIERQQATATAAAPAANGK